MRIVPGLALILAAVVGHANPARAVVLGQLDTFASGTTEGWTAGAVDPAPPSVHVGNGPAGATDNYLLVSATGAPGPGGKLVAINREQWAGDYVTAQVRAIGMDVINLGPTDLSLRLLFEAGATIPTDIAVSGAVVVPAGAGWTSVVFPIEAGDLTALQGSVATALGQTAQIRIFHNPLAQFPPPAIAAVLGVDNIHAQSEAVPVPGASFGRLKSDYR